MHSPYTLCKVTTQPFQRINREGDNLMKVNIGELTQGVCTGHTYSFLLIVQSESLIKWSGS